MVDPSPREQQEAFEKQVYHLQVVWDFHTALHEEDGVPRAAVHEDRMGVLGRTLLTALIDSCAVMLSKLTDPPKLGNHHNLSLDRYLEVSGILDVDPSIREWLPLVRGAAEAVRPYRDKLIAHFDVSHADRAYLPIGASWPDSEGIRMGVGALVHVCERVRAHRDPGEEAIWAEDQQRTSMVRHRVDWMCQALERTTPYTPPEGGS